MFSSRTLKRFVRFGLVGGSGVFVDMGALFLFYDPGMLAWGLALSKTLAAETAIVNNFIWNDLWTFRDLSAEKNGWRDRARRFTTFNLVCLAGIGFNVALLTLQVRVLRMNVYVANFVAIFLVSIWNFAMNLKFGWGGTKGKQLRHSISCHPDSLRIYRK
jgi:dolichol-phosphate mannosyltransferase